VCKNIVCDMGLKAYMPQSWNRFRTIFFVRGWNTPTTKRRRCFQSTLWLVARNRVRLHEQRIFDFFFVFETKEKEKKCFFWNVTCYFLFFGGRGGRLKTCNSFRVHNWIVIFDVLLLHPKTVTYCIRKQICVLVTFR